MQGIANGRGRRAQGGFTILEVMVAVVIFTIVMGAIYGLLAVGRSGRLNVSQRTEVTQNVRVALNTMGRDALNAGVGYPNIGAAFPDGRRAALLGGADDANTNPDMLTPALGQNNLNAVNGTATDQVSFVFIDDTFNNNSSLPVAAAQPNVATGELTLDAGFNHTNCDVNDVYVLNSNNGAALGMLTSKTGARTLNFASGDPLNMNQPGATSPLANRDYPASLLRVSWVTYMVIDEDGTQPGTGTLVRRIFGGATGWRDQPLAFGVENLQIQYILNDGRVVDVPTDLEMNLIRQVRFSITVRSPEIDPKTNQPYVDTLSGTYSTRNLGYNKF